MDWTKFLECLEEAAELLNGGFGANGTRVTIEAAQILQKCGLSSMAAVQVVARLKPLYRKQLHAYLDAKPKEDPPVFTGMPEDENPSKS